MYSGQMSWRKFAALFRQLPPESRSVTAQIDHVRDKLRPESDGPIGTPRWGAAEHLLADLFDAVRQLQHTVAVVQVGSKKAGKAPKPRLRPTDKRPLTGAQKAALYRRVLAKLTSGRSDD